MRVCVNASPAVHRIAGLGRYVQELITALLAIDPHNEYVAFYNRPGEAQLSPPLDSLPHLTTSLPNKAWRLSALLAHLAGTSQDRLFPGVDVFHATDHLLPRLARAKSVMTLHDLAFLICPQTNQPLNRWFRTLMIPRFLQAAHAVIAVSQSTKKDAVRLCRLDEAKIKVIYHGVSRHFRPAGPEAVSAVRQSYGLPGSFVLSVGTIEPRKNLTSLLEVCHVLSTGGAPPKLVIVGTKGWLHGGFFRRLRELGLEDEIILTGYVPDEDLPALYSAADLFVYPSLYEGFGLPVLEAMACGAPVITSNVSSLPEVAGEAALLVDPTSVEELVAATRSVLESKELRDELRAKGFKQAAKFSWETTARETLSVYESVLPR